jgi:gamma-glutamyltranspeptidase
MRLDFRETAPGAASQDMYNHNINGSIRGGLASGIQGDLRGLEYLHKKHGVSSFVLLELYSVDDRSGTSMESCLQSCCSRC